MINYACINTIESSDSESDSEGLLPTHLTHNDKWPTEPYVDFESLKVLRWFGLKIRIYIKE